MNVVKKVLSALLVSLTINPAISQPPDVRQFVRQVYAQGVPYEEAIRLDPATAVPILLGMLADPKEQDYWPNIVVTLGMLGDAKVVDPLIQFLKEGSSGPLSHARYIAKTSVVMALGYVVYRTGDEKALQFLMESVDPEIWTRRQIQWSSPYHGTNIERNRQLTTMSILGLGLSGNPKAAAVLRSLLGVPANPQATRLQAQIPGVRDVLNEALEANEIIAKLGMAQYYRQRLWKR